MQLRAYLYNKKVIYAGVAALAIAGVVLLIVLTTRSKSPDNVFIAAEKAYVDAINKGDLATLQKALGTVQAAIPKVRHEYTDILKKYEKSLQERIAAIQPPVDTEFINIEKIYTEAINSTDISYLENTINTINTALPKVFPEHKNNLEQYKKNIQERITFLRESNNKNTWYTNPIYLSLIIGGSVVFFVMFIILIVSIIQYIKNRKQEAPSSPVQSSKKPIIGQTHFTTPESKQEINQVLETKNK